MDTKEIKKLCKKYGVTEKVIEELIKEGFNKKEIIEILIAAEW